VLLFDKLRWCVLALWIKKDENLLIFEKSVGLVFVKGIASLAPHFWRQHFPAPYLFYN
jgi:hypothetical protein